jgi:alanine racemase
VGYADGYPRQLSGQGAFVLIEGKQAPLLGRVTMDQIIVDVTDIEQVHLGSQAVLLGKQGSKEIGARELAARAGTIAWHLFTGITERVQRCYHDLLECSVEQETWKNKCLSNESFQ